MVVVVGSHGKGGRGWLLREIGCFRGISGLFATRFCYPGLRPLDFWVASLCEGFVFKAWLVVLPGSQAEGGAAAEGGGVADSG